MPVFLLSKLVVQSSKISHPHLSFFLLKLECLSLNQTGQAAPDTVATPEYRTVNIRHQVTQVVCRNPGFGKGSIEDTLIEDILHLKMELLA